VPFPILVRGKGRAPSPTVSGCMLSAPVTPRGLDASATCWRRSLATSVALTCSVKGKGNWRDLQTRCYQYLISKEVAQVGAAIGREFSHTLLAGVLRKPEAELHLALDRLIAADLLFRQGMPPHATYFFKHALLQDAAYGTLLREPRRALHARIAEPLKPNL
jgi:hypothetical protein